jgi:hypothetical protein
MGYDPIQIKNSVPAGGALLSEHVDLLLHLGSRRLSQRAVTLANRNGYHRVSFYAIWCKGILGRQSVDPDHQNRCSAADTVAF